MVQLTRNAIYHGIESADERLKKSKGTIYVSNSVNENWFSFSFRDDGRGLQLAKIKQMTIQSGAYKESDINKWSKKRLANLIFIPGLTTTKISDITAGRGVGMDIIKNKIKKNGGSILIESDPDVFTQFTIKLPLKNR